MSYFDDLGEFQRKFNLPTAVINGGQRRVGLLSQEDFAYRLNFICEELQEFITSHAAEDLEGCADALVDLAYVVVGTAHFMGLPFDELWSEVQQCNMAKVLKREADGEHKRGKIETIRKPSGWEPPRIDMILNAARAYELENGHGE